MGGDRCASGIDGLSTLISGPVRRPQWQCLFIIAERRDLGCYLDDVLVILNHPTPGSDRLRGVFTPPPSLAVRPYILPLHTISHLGGGWWSPAVRAFGGGSPVREVGTSSCWAPPPSRQSQCGPAAPYHGRLGATARWGDKVRVEAPANGVGSSGYFSPADPSRHCDAQGAQGVKGPSPELAWSPQVRPYLTVCTCGREPSWESRYIQRRRRWRQPPTI